MFLLSVIASIFLIVLTKHCLKAQDLQVLDLLCVLFTHITL